MKRYKMFCICLCALLLTSCGERKEPEVGETCIYYINTEGTGFVREAYDITGDTKESEIENLLEAMQKVPDSADYVSPVPEDISVDKWVMDDTAVHLYFNKAYEKLKKGRELLLRASMVQTLTQVEGVDAVRFFVDDKPLADDTGREVGYMRAEDFVQNTGSSIHSYQMGDFRLYFANKTGDKLVAEDIRVRYNSNMSEERLIVERLVKGTSKNGAHPVISPDTEILGVSTKDGICYVNFNEKFLDTQYKMDPKLTIYAIVNSIVESGVAGQVQILVNGEKDVRYQGSVDLSRPFSADSQYVEGEN